MSVFLKSSNIEGNAGRSASDFSGCKIFVFHHCSVDVKLALFRSYCTCFYCPFLWTHYKKSNYSKLRVAFNNVYRRILKFPSRSSASTMYVVNNIDSL